MKKARWITAIAGAALTVVGIVAPLIAQAMSGLDMVSENPLYWFFDWGYGWSVTVLLVGLGMLFSAVTAFLGRARIAETCTLKTTGLLLGVVAALSLLLLNGFRLLAIYLIPELGGFSDYPVTVIFGLIVIVVCVLALIVLLRMYVKERRAFETKIGILWDLLQTVWYFVPLMMVWSLVTKGL